MNYAITYGDQRFAAQRHKAAESLAKYCETTLYTEKELDPYRASHSEIIYPGARGGGYWLYKPLFLLEKIQQIGEGDGLLWMDAGCDLIGDPEPLFDIAHNNDGICLFQQNHKNIRFVHKECFQHMGCDEEKYHQDYQCDAAVIVLTKTTQSLMFLFNWYWNCSIPKLIKDPEAGITQYPEFIDHRHDQSVLTLLALEHGLPRFKSPTQFGAEENLKEFLTFYERAVSSMYPTLFNHHRIRC
jgi:hypothetical protein